MDDVVYIGWTSMKDVGCGREYDCYRLFSHETVAAMIPRMGVEIELPPDITLSGICVTLQNAP